MIAAIILGIIQGLTEFFPVSSSGHLLLLPKLSDALGLGLNFDFQDTQFDVVLHIATFLAILIAYKQKIWKIFTKITQPEQKQTVINIVFVSIPAVIVSGILFLGDDEIVKNEDVATFMLILVGFLLIFAEFSSKYAANTLTYDKLSPQKAFVIGIFQMLALLRGVSRSGITLIGGMQMGLKREEALDFAFLAALPIFALATIAQILELITDQNATQASTMQLSVGFVAALVTGILVIEIFKKIINRKGMLAAFGVYRIILGIILLLVL
jgi:undecaprenyl-diphosphatase